MGRDKKHKPRAAAPASPLVVIKPDMPPLTIAWDANADQALAAHVDNLVIVAPNAGQARAFAFDLGSPDPLIVHRPLCVTDAEQWRGSRSDYPGALLACIRYEGDTPACADAIRYRALMQAVGQRSLI
ncbi:hypothetical protein ACWGQT_00035 [Streptomyces yangpuensis]